MPVLLGIDLGTSAVKVGAFESDTLRPLAAATRAYPIEQTGPGWAEQTPEVWWRAVQAALQEIRSLPLTEIAAIGVAGQMHGLVCLDSTGTPVRPAILWPDTRARRQVDALRQLWHMNPAAMPGPPATGFAAASARWLSEHEPHTLQRTALWLAPKDYLVFRLTGRLGSEPSDASASWLYSVTQQAWSPQAIAACSLALSQMPPLAESAAVVGALSPVAATGLGLRPGAPVVAGCADLTAQALAHGVLIPGGCLIVAGTGGQVVVPRPTPAPDPAGRYYVFAHCQPAHWYAQAATLAAGLALTWLRTALGGPPTADLIAEAGRVAPGADGLLFLPYLVGERSPHLDPLASGALVGLRFHHTRAHLVRAVLEGVAFALKDCLTVIAAAGDGPTAAVVTGGLTRAQVWCQILADVLETPLRVSAMEVEAGCLGAALLAGQGAGLGVDQPETGGRVVAPQSRPVYRQRYAHYQGLYTTLKHDMHRLGIGTNGGPVTGRGL
jgi:xylulokinase